MVAYFTMPVEKMYLEDSVIDLQKRLFIPKDFFKNLFSKDDKSFMLRLYELIEAKCSSLLLYHLKVPTLSNLISRLPLSSNTSSKAQFLQELRLLDDQEIKYISALTQLRGQFLKETGQSVTLKQIIADLDYKSLWRFAMDFSPFETTIQKYSNLQPNLLDREITRQIDPATLIERAKTEPKLHIWSGASHLLHALADMDGFSEYLKQEQHGGH
jgi:hypothetical protein